MKKILSILLALVLVLTLGLVTAGSALALDMVDTCIANNEDFIAGGGWDGGSLEFVCGAQPWPYPRASTEAYNLYQDDATGTGNLDSVFILTSTKNAIDLTVIDEYWYQNTGTYWLMGDESSNSWYWATEPRFVTKAEVLQGSGVPGNGLDGAPGLQKPFNPNSQAGDNSGRK